MCYFLDTKETKRTEDNNEIADMCLQLTSIPAEVRNLPLMDLNQGEQGIEKILVGVSCLIETAQVFHDLC